MKERLLIGVDIGGSKCAVVAGDESPRIIERTGFPTGRGPAATIARITEEVVRLKETHGRNDRPPAAVGISAADRSTAREA